MLIGTVPLSMPLTGLTFPRFAYTPPKFPTIEKVAIESDGKEIRAVVWVGSLCGRPLDGECRNTETGTGGTHAAGAIDVRSISHGNASNQRSREIPLALSRCLDRLDCLHVRQISPVKTSRPAKRGKDTAS